MIRSPAGFDGGDRIKRYLDYYQPSYGVMMLSAGQFSPASLFAAGEQGAWYDPSDFSTMFQDSAGTTPVTAVEQPVGLLLDKSKGLALGAELVTNGDFASDTAWTKGTGWTIGSGVATRTAVGAQSFLEETASVVNGSWYKVSFTVTALTAGDIGIRLGSNVIGNQITATATGTYTGTVQCGGTDGKIYMRASSGFAGSIDNISVKALAGNHASQSTSASRPVLSARVNLLTYSEQFDNAAWTQALVTPTSNTTTAPNGTLTADTAAFGASANARISQSITTVSVPYTFSVWLKADSAQSIRIGNVLGALSTVSVTTEWQQFSYTFTPSAGANGIGLQNASDALSRSVYVWGADLRVTNVGVGLPAYQRIAAATDYDTSGFPLYLKFDGTDDSLATGSIDFSATDKMSVFAGVRKLSDAASALLAELSATLGSNAGSFYFGAPELTGAQGDFSFKSRGSITPASVAQTATLLAPITRVLTGLGDISGDIASIRQNGVQVNYSADQGTGNYGNYPLYIGRRNNASFPFNGNLYSLIVRGALSTDAQIASTETWVNGKTKAY